MKDQIGQALAASKNFGEVVANLLKMGIESYHVDFLRGETRYYHTNGESVVKSLGEPDPKIALGFSAAEVEAAIRKSQAGKIDYPQFVVEAKAAGCVYYIAYLTGRNVTYLGRKGEMHIEKFPGAK